MMDSLEKQINNLLKEYDNSIQKFNESNISDSIRRSTKSIKKENIPDSVFADILAFDFSENYHEKSDGWGTYFGPLFASKSNEGEIIQYPDIKQVTSLILSFWEKRTNELKHPILLQRYNLLIYEFYKIVTGSIPDYKFAVNAINNIISIADNECYSDDIYVFEKLEYALILALKVNNADLIEKTYKALISFEKKVAENNKPGLWGHAFVLLDNKKITLSNDIKIYLIRDMEERLNRLINDITSNFNPWAVERASLLLANYYRKVGKQDDVQRVLIILERAFDRISKDASPIQVSSWQQNIHRYFKEYGLNKEAERIAVKIQKVGPQMAKDLKQITHKIDIQNDDMEKFMSQFYDLDLDSTYKRIASIFIPKRIEIEKQLDELFNSAPLSFLVNKQIIDYNGVPIATIGSLEDDRIGNVVQQMAQNLKISSIFLGFAIEETKKRFKMSYEDFVQYLYESPLFLIEKKPFIELGIKYYFENSYVECIHILIPQIEDLVRNLIDIGGGTTLKSSRNGGIVYKTLEELLRDDIFLNTLGEDISLYLRGLFTDIRGWNIRNNLCHGLIRIEMLNHIVADRLIHVLLLLTLVKVEKS